MSEKSILEQALLQVNTLEEAVRVNAKSIIASTMKQEIKDLLKESLEEEEETADAGFPKKEEEEEDMTEPGADDAEDEEADDAEDEEADDEAGEENDEMPSINDEPSDDESDVDDMGAETDDELPSIDGDDMSADDDMLDMTNASDDEVLKVFKAMGDQDGIVVKKDGNKIEFQDGEDDYIIKLNEEEEYSEDEIPGEMAEEEEQGEETVYEIELDGEDDDDTKETPEQETAEAARTFGAGVRGPAQKTKWKAGRHKMNESEEFKAILKESETLKQQNAEYKKALVLFKDKLNEVAVFNANLAYATRLFTEHSTTKNEKLDILKRFDTISSINESKNLYKQIKAELDTKTTVSESVAAKIASTPSTSSSEVLAESKVYEAPQFARMKDLMKKIK